MAGRRSKSERRAQKRSKEAPRPHTISEGVTVRAVHAASGRPATAVQVEVDAERVKRQVDRFEEVKEVVAEFPSAEDGDRVRWEEQKLEKTSEEIRPGGERTLRYSGTRYEGCDAPRFGIGVRLETPEGTLETPRGGSVREADKPGEGESAPGAPVED